MYQRVMIVQFLRIIKTKRDSNTPQAHFVTAKIY